MPSEVVDLEEPSQQLPEEELVEDSAEGLEALTPPPPTQQHFSGSHDGSQDGFSLRLHADSQALSPDSPEIQDPAALADPHLEPTQLQQLSPKDEEQPVPSDYDCLEKDDDCWAGEKGEEEGVEEDNGRLAPSSPQTEESGGEASQDSCVDLLEGEGSKAV